MTRLRWLFSITFPALVFTRCEQKTKQPDIEKNLLDVISKYPQLPKGQGNQSNFYQLIRSITIGGSGVGLQLRSSPDSLNDPQKIIIVINQAKETYVIPFFSNTYQDYWSFRFDSVLTSVKKTKTTFEKELKNCLKQLNLYDTSGTAGKVINEMLFSLLQCQQVRETDSAILHSFSLTNNDALPFEDSDSCYKRLKKNWQEMIKEFHPKDYLINYNAFWDRRNSRIYQFDFKNLNRKEKVEFSIRTYRLDCVYKMLTL